MAMIGFQRQVLVIAITLAFLKHVVVGSMRLRTAKRYPKPRSDCYWLAADLTGWCSRVYVGTYVHIPCLGRDRGHAWLCMRTQSNKTICIQSIIPTLYIVIYLLRTKYGGSRGCLDYCRLGWPRRSNCSTLCIRGHASGHQLLIEYRTSRCPC
jgi:hypothetical protein